MFPGSYWNSDAQTRAKSYYLQSEMNHPTMICPTALIDQASSDHRKAYARTNFDLNDSTSKFTSEFHIDEFPDILRQIHTDIWISEQLIEID